MSNRLLFFDSHLHKKHIIIIIIVAVFITIDYLF